MSGTVDSVLFDFRSTELYRNGHVPGALSVTVLFISEERMMEFSINTSVVVYYAGPRCKWGRQGGDVSGETRATRQGDDWWSDWVVGRTAHLVKMSWSWSCAIFRRLGLAETLIVVRSYCVCLVECESSRHGDVYNNRELETC